MSKCKYSLTVKTGNQSEAGPGIGGGVNVTLTGKSSLAVRGVVLVVNSRSCSCWNAFLMDPRCFYCLWY